MSLPIEILNQQIQSLQAYIAANEGLDATASKKQSESVDALLGIVEEMKAQQAASAKVIAAQQARLEVLESEKNAERQARINQEKIASQRAQELYNIERAKKDQARKELKDLFSDALYNFRCADQIVTVLINNTPFNMNCGTKFPETHFIHIAYTSSSIEANGHTRYFYSNFHKDQLPHFVHWRDHYKLSYEAYEKQIKDLN